MPRGIRRRAKAKCAWTTEQRSQLVTGFEFFGHGFGREVGHPTRPLDLALARQAWDDLRVEILDEFTAANPFTRPWAWWQFDATEPRDEAPEDGTGDDASVSLGTPAWWARHREGLPFQQWSMRPSRGCESFREYLTRLGLLTDAERELVRIERHRRANP